MTPTDLIKRHLGSPEITVQAYLEASTATVWDAIQGRRRLYLDTKYWVYIRDAHLGQARRPEHVEVLRRLRELVSSGRAVCPVSDIAFAELTTQSDDRTRIATAQLQDELSLGTALKTEEERVHAELAHFFAHMEQAEKSPVPTRPRVWIKPCFVFGVSVPSDDAVPASINQAVQKATIDTLWTMSFEELAQESTAHLKSKEMFDRTASQINSDLPLYAHEATNFATTFQSEIIGGLSAAEVMVKKVVLERALASGIPIDSLKLEELNATHEMAMRALVNSFRLARSKLALQLSTLYVHAMCHTAIRLDKGRRFNGNFIRDIHHGAAAVPYFDAMLTEHPLKVLLTSGTVAVDKLFGCRVVSTEEDVLAYLDGLTRTD